MSKKRIPVFRKDQKLQRLRIATATIARWKREGNMNEHDLVGVVTFLCFILIYCLGYRDGKAENTAGTSTEEGE